MPRLPGPPAPLLLLGAALLAGCESQPKFPPACPALALLRDAADLTRYAPGTHDIRGLIIDARIVGAPATCESASPTTVRAKVGAAFDVTRGPAASGRAIALPYFVAVMLGGRIVDKSEYTLAGVFPPNTDAVRMTSEDITLLFPVTKDRSAAAYQVFVGFSLTPEELAVNRQRGPR